MILKDRLHTQLQFLQNEIKQKKVAIYKNKMKYFDYVMEYLKNFFNN